MSRSGFNPSGPRLPIPCLMLVTDRHLAGGEDRLVEMVAQAVDGGVNVVQLREKDLLPPNLLTLARRLRDVTRGRAMLLVNGPLAVATAAGGDGVHLPEDAAPPEPPWTYVWGCSVHSLEGAVRAMGGAARYLVAGPVFHTQSHPQAQPLGVGFIRELCEIALVPVIAIGGVTAENAGDVMRAGASGVAVISAVLGRRSPAGAARMLRESLDVAYAGGNGARP
ncbi:MAG: thiamine phosphate synthase [Dehalococcoidia bacterium]|nr:thiamine phosphate synthase [Dehalococcoidia bacterium]